MEEIWNKLRLRMRMDAWIQTCCMLSTQQGMQAHGQNPKKAPFISFPSFASNVSKCQRCHLWSREAPQQSRRQRWALTGSWWSHVPVDNERISNIRLAPFFLIISFDQAIAGRPLDQPWEYFYFKYMLCLHDIQMMKYITYYCNSYFVLIWA